MTGECGDSASSSLRRAQLCRPNHGAPKGGAAHAGSGVRGGVRGRLMRLLHDQFFLRAKVSAAAGLAARHSTCRNLARTATRALPAQAQGYLARSAYKLQEIQVRARAACWSSCSTVKQERLLQWRRRRAQLDSSARAQERFKVVPEGAQERAGAALARRTLAHRSAAHSRAHRSALDRSTAVSDVPPSPSAGLPVWRLCSGGAGTPRTRRVLVRSAVQASRVCPYWCKVHRSRTEQSKWGQRRRSWCL